MKGFSFWPDKIRQDGKRQDNACIALAKHDQMCVLYLWNIELSLTQPPIHSLPPAISLHLTLPPFVTACIQKCILLPRLVGHSSDSLLFTGLAIQSTIFLNRMYFPPIPSHCHCHCHSFHWPADWYIDQPKPDLRFLQLIYGSLTPIHQAQWDHTQYCLALVTH